MIAANDLRIGNYLLYNGNILKVTCIDLDLDDEGVELVCFQDSNPVELNYGKVLPIPLTPKILKKCGFEKYDDTNEHARINPTYRKGKFGLEYRKRINRYTVMWYDANDDYGTPIIVCVDYLHQLQNLHYALTFQELNYQP